MKGTRQSARPLRAAVFAVGVLVGTAYGDDGAVLVLELGEHGAHVLAVENTTETDWRIDRVRASCDCVQIDAHPAVVPSGMTVDLALTVTGRGVGQYVFQVDLYGDLGGASNRSYDLPISVVPATGGAPEGLHRLHLASRARDHNLYRSAADILADADSPMILDTRKAGDFHMTHVPGARRVEAQALRRRPGDPSRPVVLVDAGFGDAATERACRRLRANGSGPVHILRGGLAAWIAAGGRVEGPMRSRPSLAAISAEAFLPLAGYDDWRLLVYTGPSAVASVALSDEQVVFLDAGVGEAATARTVEAWLADPAQPVRVLIVDRDAARARERTQAARTAGADGVYYVSDGADSLATEIRFHQQTRLASRQTLSTVTHGGNADSTKGGCSGCP